jgi:hypothetical protein
MAVRSTTGISALQLAAVLAGRPSEPETLLRTSAAPLRRTPVGVEPQPCDAQLGAAAGPHEPGGGCVESGPTVHGVQLFDDELRRTTPVTSVCFSNQLASKRTAFTSPVAPSSLTHHPRPGPAGARAAAHQRGRGHGDCAAAGEEAARQRVNNPSMGATMLVQDCALLEK